MSFTQDEMRLIRKAMDLFGEIYFKAVGNSMFPAIRENQLVKVKKIDLAKIKVGDVLVFEVFGSIIAHRVVSTQHKNFGPIFITKEDNSQEYLSSKYLIAKPEDVLGIIP